AMIEDAAGNIWISNALGLAFFNEGQAENGRQIVELEADSVSYPYFKASSFLKGKGEEIWCMTSRGILQITPTFQLIPFPFEDFSAEPRGTMLASGAILYAHGNGIVKYAEGQHKRQLESAELAGTSETKPSVNRLFEDSDGIVWIGTSNGLFQFGDETLDPASMRFHLPEMEITCIAEDDEQNLWVTTMSDGIYFISRNAIYVDNFNAQSGLDEDKVTALNYHEGHLWIGHQNGNFTHIHDGKVKATLQNTSSGLSRKIRALARNTDGTLWAAADIGLYYMPPETERFLSLDIGVNKNLRFSKSGNLLLSNGLFFLSLPADHIPALCTEFAASSSFWERTKAEAFFRPHDHAWERTYVMHMDEKGQLFTGNKKGLYRHARMGNAGNMEKAVLEYSVNDMLTDAANRIFVATADNGLVIMDGGKTYQYGTVEGLAGNSCRKLLLENDSTLWVATNSGLSRVSMIKGNPANVRIDHFNQSDGLSGQEITSLAMAGDSLMVGTLGGLSVFPISKMQSSSNPPRIYITGFQVWDKPMEWTPNMRLAPDENDITFHFTGLSFKSGGRISYKYRLSGLDENWQYSQQPFVRYPPLAPGNYTFEVIAISEKNVESRIPATVQFSIQTPIWQTWWFWTLVIAGLVLLVYLFVAERIRQIKFKERLRRQVLESEQNALLAQMNPHFIFNALNSIQRFIAQNDKKEAAIYLSKFANLVRSTLDNSRKPRISLEHEMRNLQLYLDLESLRFKDKL
ncbi:MAG: histidine kinase, partial [Bacteroidota bacterium]